MRRKSSKPEKKSISIRLGIDDLAKIYRARAAIGAHRGVEYSLPMIINELIDLGTAAYAETCGVPGGVWEISPLAKDETIYGVYRLIMAWHKAILPTHRSQYIQGKDLAIKRINGASNIKTRYAIEEINLHGCEVSDVCGIVVTLAQVAVEYDCGRALPLGGDRQRGILRQIWAAAAQDGVAVVRQPMEPPYTDVIGRFAGSADHRAAWVAQQRRM